MTEHTEVKSDNARNVILSYGDTVYFVNKVNIQFQEGLEKLKAIFHARRAADNQIQDLEVEISQEAYNMLTEYAKMDKFDLILVLKIEDNDSKWCLLSENWLKKQSNNSNSDVKSSDKTRYIV